MPVERHLRALETTIDGPLTLGELTHRMHHAGFGLIVLFVCVPFLQPLPLAGLSTVFGVFIAFQGLQLVRGRPEPRLPAWLARRSLETKTLHLLLGAARRFFSLADRFTRPRWRPLAANERAVGAAWVLCGLALALPFPIPMSNMICATPVALLSLALLEEDGLIALFGWLGVLTMIAFHVGLLLLGAEGTRALWRAAFP
jgi:hypothetical protein